jgi:DNA recombination protein RmuC
VDLTTILLIIITSGLAIAIFLLLKKKPEAEKKDDQIINQRFDSLNLSMGQMKDSVNQALRDTLKIVNDQLKECRESVQKSSMAINQQVHGFASGITQLQENVKNVLDSVKEVSSFQDIFKSPKLRGNWGEASLEASLSQYFSKDNYEIQHRFKSNEVVDAILKLPNDLILPIDSKFNWENFEKMINSDNEIHKDQFRKIFFSDVRKKIDEIANKYILPSEFTTDFALMFVPAETVYYEIINNIKEVDIPAYARGKKVILVSPNTFFLSVSAIRHWIKDVQLSKQTKEIMRKLDRIKTDGNKLDEDFKRLGKHISDAQGSYENSSKRLGLMVNRVQNVLEIEEPEVKEKEIETPMLDE